MIRIVPFSRLWCEEGRAPWAHRATPISAGVSNFCARINKRPESSAAPVDWFRLRAQILVRFFVSFPNYKKAGRKLCEICLRCFVANCLLNYRFGGDGSAGRPLWDKLNEARIMENRSGTMKMMGTKLWWSNEQSVLEWLLRWGCRSCPAWVVEE